ncbi:MAG: hypothetical protein K6G27_02630 [Lachnospiraceae bacterium]|nr:hypothetical protein [Lachnospiraceae bacterium]
MLGRRLLKRLTRLGLATYAMTYCMAFTVCASENPIADLAVADTVQVLEVEAGRDSGLNSDLLSKDLIKESEDGEIIGADGLLEDGAVSAGEEPDKLQAEDLLVTHEGEEGEAFFTETPKLPPAVDDEGEAVDPDYVEFNCSALTVTDLNQSYPFTVYKGRKPIGNISQISFGLADNKNGTGASPSFRGASISEYGILNFSSSTESMTFYVIADVEGRIASCKVVVYVPIEEIEFECDTDSRQEHGKNINMTVNETAECRRAKAYIMPVGQSYNLLNISRISYELLENGEQIDKNRGINMTVDERGLAHIDFLNLTRSGLFEIRAKYNNAYVDAEGVNRTYANNPEAVCRLNISVKGDVPLDDYEAHLSDKSLKVQMYKSKNPLAVTFRNANTGTTAEVDDYVITNCSFTNSKLNDFSSYGLLNLGVLEDGKTVNINASKSFVDAGSVPSFIKEFKKGISTGLEVSVKATINGTRVEDTFTTNENVTITFGDTKPTAKDIKAVGTLEFNSYEAGREGHGITFQGPEVGRIMTPPTKKDKEAYFKAGLDADSDAIAFNSTSSMPAKGNGKLNVLVFLNDTEYNLPSNYNISVPVSYKITNGAPVLTLDQSSALLNCAPSDYLLVSFGIKGMTGDTLVMCDVKDSKGHAINGTAPITASAFLSGTSGYVYLGANDGIEYGTSYKVEIYPQNDVSGRKGVKKVITVKTPAEKAVQSFTTKQKGTIDAGIPMSAVYLTLSGKNVNLLLKTPVNVTTTLKNGEDISDLLTYYVFPDEKLNPVFILYEKSPFLLLEKGLGGQQYVTKIAYNISGNTITTEYKGKISNSVVTPKLEESRISINPDANFNQTIRIPVTNLPGGEYKYDIKNNSPFGINVTSELARDYVEISTDTISDSAYGKTFEIAITPKVPEKYNANLSAKAATLKIAVLNPKKNAAAMSAKVKGGIDAVRDDTNATAVISFKNIYDPESMIEDIVCEDIVLKGKGKSTPLPCYENFNCTIDGNKVIFTRMPGKNIQAGTYVATLAAVLNNGRRVTGTVEFKVVRGKTNTVVKPSPAVLINRDNARYTTVYISPKKNDANAIINATIVADKNKFDEYFSLEQIKDKPGTYRLRVQKGYYEKQVKKSIVSLITKVVSKSVKVNVYYNGSTEYETVTVKVKIKP